jgi:ABC-2 type transport system permease protein
LVGPLRAVREVWDARHLTYELARADLVRHTSRLRLGILWWFLDPLVLALIYWGLVDQLLGRGESIHPRYWLFLFLGLIVWKQFAQCLSGCSGVYNRRQGLIKNLAVPLVTLPGAVVLQTFHLFVQAILVVIVFLGISGGVSLGWIQLLGLLGIQFITMFGIGLMVAAPMARQPDLRELVPHFLKVLFYLSPVLYSFDFLQAKLEGSEYLGWLNVYILVHPVGDLIDAYRHVLLDDGVLSLNGWVILVARSALYFSAGCFLQDRFQRHLLEGIR